MNREFLQKIITSHVSHWLEQKISEEELWKDSIFFDYYRLRDNVSRGNYGERLTSGIMMELFNSFVEDRVNRQHDYWIDGHKTEVKVSINIPPKKFVFNHLAMEKDWDRAILLGINACTYEMFMGFFTKQEFIDNYDWFKHQQGGKKSKNDDFMCGPEVFNQPFMKKIELWRPTAEKFLKKAPISTLLPLGQPAL